MRILRDMIFEYKLEKSIHKPDDFCRFRLVVCQRCFVPNYNKSSTGKMYFKPKYGVHEPRGLALSSMTTKPYTIHFWRDLVKNKYKLKSRRRIFPQSLWELLIKRIEAM